MRKLTQEEIEEIIQKMTVPLAMEDTGGSEKKPELVEQNREDGKLHL